MHRAARLLPALTGLIAAGAAYAHPGDHPHAHPHLDFFVIVIVLAAVAGIAWGVWRARKWGQTPFSSEAGNGVENGEEKGV